MLSVIFSAIGYGLLAFLVFTEADPKRRKFLLVIFIYTGLSFLILFQLS